MSDFAYDDRPSCPFCPFSVASLAEREMYLLLKHLELVHPENGESPFLAKERGAVNRGNSSTLTPISKEDGFANDNADADGKLIHQPNVEGTTRGGSQHLWTESGIDDCFVECPLHCGEAIHNRELDHHMELHETQSSAMEEDSLEISKSPEYLPPSTPSLLLAHRKAPTKPELGRGDKILPATKGYSFITKKDSPSSHRSYKALSTLGNFKGLFLGPAPKKTRSSHPQSKLGPRRLGKTELGPYAYEDQMPTWLYKQLHRGAKATTSSHLSNNGKVVHTERVANEIAGILPILGQLCQQDSSILKVYLCHSTVKHIFKMSREGGFCGYRNIQMVISFIQSTKSPGHEHFPGQTPSILLLQDLIEKAWDKGIGSSGRIETGGIRGTRKYIGTPEAQALFTSLGVGCDASAFNACVDKAKETVPVHYRVLQAVLEYFESSAVMDNTHKVHQTGLAPLYFQHPGHSLTIVGIEVRKSGAMNLLVLDPMFRTNPGIIRLIGSKFRSSAPERLLKSFRRGDVYLGRYNSFEILRLTEQPAYGNNVVQS